MIDNGATVAHVSRQMGHASPAITLAIYTDEFRRRENVELTRTTLDAVIGTSLETAGGERGRNDDAAGLATVAEIGSTSGLTPLAATAGD